MPQRVDGLAAALASDARLPRAPHEDVVDRIGRGERAERGDHLQEHVVVVGIGSGVLEVVDQGPAHVVRQRQRE